MTWIIGLFRSKLARQIGGVLLVIVSVISFGAIQKRKGVVKERQRQERNDNENAGNIRDNADTARKLHKSKPHGYRND